MFDERMQFSSFRKSVKYSYLEGSSKTPGQVRATGERAKPMAFVNSTLILFCVITSAPVENLKNFSRISLVASLINLKKTKYND